MLPTVVYQKRKQSLKLWTVALILISSECQFMARLHLKLCRQSLATTQLHRSWRSVYTEVWQQLLHRYLQNLWTLFSSYPQTHAYLTLDISWAWGYSVDVFFHALASPWIYISFFSSTCVKLVTKNLYRKLISSSYREAYFFLLYFCIIIYS